jgi:molybdopterin-containing oxidoreductase family iron-sulfur binding subunit
MITRRALLEWTAASAALAACARAPRREIVPYATQPKDVRPGVPKRYATAHAIDGYAMGLVVETHDGRPTKVEGNPRHPASLGAARAFDQALIASLYDPDRTSGVEGPDGPSSFEALRAAFAGAKRLAVVLEPTSSPSVIDRVRRLRDRGALVRFHAPLARENAWSASRVATGGALDVELACENARAVVAIDSDFLASGPWCLRDARRLVEQRARAGARVYAVEARRSVTGAFADHRIAASSRDRALFARGLFREVVRAKPDAPAALRALADRFEEASTFAKACARDLVAAGRNAAVTAGDGEAVEIHLVTHALASLLGAHGVALALRPSPIFEAGAFGPLDLEDADSVVFCGTNPMYSTRVDLGARLSAHVGVAPDETAKACRWRAPLAHPLESWSDMRAPDGTLSIAQPLIEPLRHGVTVCEVLAALLGEAPAARSITRASFAGDERAWNEALESGVVNATASATVTPAIDADAIARALDAWRVPNAPPIEVALHASHAAHDGRFAGNPWLLELPDPITKLTWGNHAVTNAVTAAKLGAKEGDVVRVAGAGGAIELPVAIDDATATGVVAIAHGYGRDWSSLVRGVGANAFVLRSAEPVRVERTNRHHPLARTQVEFSLHGRDAIARTRARTAAPLVANEKKRVSMYGDPSKHSRGWAMVIDLAACTGCSACVIACQAENNIPIVGEEGVRAGRAMHWIRIDRYDDPKHTIAQPMLCQHCDEAPCEYVCPVNATVHSPDGLNEMVYNRCVGTRFCSNNCPYKVRRFNWFDYHEDETPLAQLAHNPDVTVRARGVMEKCTFCVQRIREAEHVAIVEHRDLRRDEVTTACAQSCPTRAITFGDAEDPGSAVSAARKNVEAYEALGELGTRPRVRYLPKIVDPNAELE